MRSVLQLAWPKELNQILATTAGGDVVMLYSPFSSRWASNDLDPMAHVVTKGDFPYRSWGTRSVMARKGALHFATRSQPSSRLLKM